MSDMDEDSFTEVVSGMIKIQKKWETYNQELAEKIQDIVVKTVQGEKDLNAEYRHIKAEIKQKIHLEKQRTKELEKSLEHSTKRLLDIDTKKQELKEVKTSQAYPLEKERTI